MRTVLVTGGNGQLAKCIENVSSEYSELKFIFNDLPEFDITNQELTNSFFSKMKIDWCVNCAAYTAVDKAEIEKDKAFETNSIGARNIALACRDNQTNLVHISTDYVFDGNSCKAYTEDDKTNPIGIYGSSKLDGEKEIATVFNNFFIIRTSWLYSEYGHNFLNSMVGLSKNKNEINIVVDQIGTPTYAKDLAMTICEIIVRGNNSFGIYNYSNEGVASWYDFAKAIFDIKNHQIKINPISTDEYPTLVKRPKFSVLDKSKIKETFNVHIPYWRDSLKKAILKCNEQ